MAISPDGRYTLTAGASDGTARLWDLSTRKAVQVFSPEGGFVLDTAFTPDGRYALASAGNMALMWAVEDGQLVRTFELAGPVGAPSLTVSATCVSCHGAQGLVDGSLPMADADDACP